MSNSYQILGLQPGATDEEVKKAYKALARKYHPDKGGTADKFKEINEAYTQITKGEDPSQDFPELSEIFKMFGLFGMGGMGGMGGMNIHNFMKGPTIFTNVNLTLEQLEQGGSFKLKYNRRVPTGRMQNIQMGPMIMMTPEEVEKEFEVEIVIPPCYDQRKSLIFTNAAKAENLPPGDLEVILILNKHETFTRIAGSLDLEISLSITLKEALVGFSRDIKLLNLESVKIECESIVNPYDSKIIPNYGMQKEEEKGNLVIKFKIQFPVLISQETKETLDKLDDF